MQDLVPNSSSVYPKNEEFHSYFYYRVFDIALSVGVLPKSKRASPSNPIEYKVLRKVAIRIGRSVYPRVLEELKEGNVVVINQIKRRSGRVKSSFLQNGFVEVQCLQKMGTVE